MTILPLVLTASAYDIHFDFGKDPTLSHGLLGRIRIRSTEPTHEHEISSGEFMLLIDDLRRLSYYFKTHIQKLIVGNTLEDYFDQHVFIDESFQYRIQAHYGRIENPEMGSFNLTVMVRVGWDAELRDDIYCGIRTRVRAEAINAWLENINTLIKSV